MRLEYFQLIDRIVDLKPAERTIRVEADVPEHNSIFEGHFPGYPLMPGVLLTEAMAQSSGWLIIAHQRFKRMPFLAGIKDAKFRDFVNPGDKLLIQAKLVHDGSGFAVTEAKVERNGKLVCDATITFRVVPFPNEQIDGYIRGVAKAIGFPFEVVE
jgi:3-hydroxyacyl-[acyl-carrier-protein] dehydratase